MTPTLRSQMVVPRLAMRAALASAMREEQEELRKDGDAALFTVLETENELESSPEPQGAVEKDISDKLSVASELSEMTKKDEMADLFDELHRMVMLTPTFGKIARSSRIMCPKNETDEDGNVEDVISQETIEDVVFVHTENPGMCYGIKQLYQHIKSSRDRGLPMQDPYRNSISDDDYADIEDAVTDEFVRMLERGQKIVPSGSLSYPVQSAMLIRDYCLKIRSGRLDEVAHDVQRTAPALVKVAAYKAILKEWPAISSAWTIDPQLGVITHGGMRVGDMRLRSEDVLVGDDTTGWRGITDSEMEERYDLYDRAMDAVRSLKPKPSIFPRMFVKDTELAWFWTWVAATAATHGDHHVLRDIRMPKLVATHCLKMLVYSVESNPTKAGNKEEAYQETCRLLRVKGAEPPSGDGSLPPMIELACTQ